MRTSSLLLNDPHMSNSEFYFKITGQSMPFININLTVNWDHLNWSFSWLADIKSHEFGDLIKYKWKVFSLGCITYCRKLLIIEFTLPCIHGAFLTPFCLKPVFASLFFVTVFLHHLVQRRWERNLLCAFVAMVKKNSRNSTVNKEYQGEEDISSKLAWFSFHYSGTKKRQACRSKILR